MSEENFNALLEKQRNEMKSTLASTEQFIFNESLTENLKPSPLKSLDQLIKERQTQAHTLLSHFIEELRHSIDHLHKKSTEEEQQQLRLWMATFWAKLIQWQMDSTDILHEEDILAGLEGNKVWEMMEVLVMLKRERPVAANAKDAFEEEPPKIGQEGLEIIYAIIQRYINDYDLKGVSGLYRLSLMFNPLQRDLWMEYAQHAWTFETPEVAEAIYAYALDLFPGDFYIRICFAEFFHATERDAEAKNLTEDSLKQLREHRWEDTPTYEAFIELNKELRTTSSVA